MNHGANQVLKMLKRRKKAGLTAMDAVNKLGIYRLGARILDLRQAGHNIETVMEAGQNRYGHQVRYARYVLR